MKSSMPENLFALTLRNLELERDTSIVELQHMFNQDVEPGIINDRVNLIIEKIKYSTNIQQTIEFLKRTFGEEVPE